jgi:hypothetical protein
MSIRRLIVLVEGLLRDTGSETFRSMVPSARAYTSENILANLFDLTAGVEGAYPRPGDAERKDAFEAQRHAALEAQRARTRARQAEGAT